MNMNKPPMKIAGAACGAVALVIGLAAIGVPKWLVLDLGLATASFGLWRACATVPITGDVQCVSYVTKPDWIIATSAIEVAGICVIFFAVLLAFLHISVAKNSKAAGRVPGPSAVTGGVIMIVGTIIWAVKYKDEEGLALCDLSWDSSSPSCQPFCPSLLEFCFSYVGERNPVNSHLRDFEYFKELNVVNFHP